VTNGYMPLGGVLVGERVAGVMLAGGGEFAHGLTYSGHPVSCAAGIATLSLLREGKIIENAARDLAPLLQERLRAFESHPIVGQVRGRGMLAAVELVRDKSTRERLAPESEAAVFCRDTANERGLMVRQTGDAMIMAPPLVCEPAQIELLVERLGEALDITARHYGVSA